MERRFHNPYRHWLSGLGFEIAVFLGFLVAASTLAVLVAWVFG